ncbi:hypothetical protein GW916_13225, partial [bacterium]|nr:hypothetical protein [bacterium]
MKRTQLELRRHFNQLCEKVFASLKVGEKISLGVEGEMTDYVRWNQSQVRQWSELEQFDLKFELQSDEKTAKGVLQVGFSDIVMDIKEATAFLSDLRKQLEGLSSDPFFVPLDSLEKSERLYSGPVVEPEQMVQQIGELAKDLDLAGQLCSGYQFRAVQNSLGQSHWFSTYSYFFDYSLYHGDRASKAILSGETWSEERLSESLQETADQLTGAMGDQIQIPPGKYRVYLSPSAVAEICGTLSWGGFSAKGFKQESNPMGRFFKGEKVLSPQLSLRENFGLGLAPRFNSTGGLSPEVVEVIEKGQPKNLLVSKSTAKEFSMTSNGADEGEYPRSLEILPGDLNREQVYSALNDGIYITQLHYLNWSD